MEPCVAVLSLALPSHTPQLDTVKRQAPLPSSHHRGLVEGVAENREKVETSSTCNIIFCLPEFLKLMWPAMFPVNVKLIWKVFMYCFLP